MAKTINDINHLGSGYLYLISIHQNSGRLDSAGFYLKKLGVLSNSNISNTKLKIHYNQAAGLYYKNQGQFRMALPFMEDNLLLLTVENEGRAGQYLNIGNTYFNLGEYHQAVQNHLQALALFEKLKNKRGQSFCLQSLGNDFISLEQFQQAKEYYLRSLKLKEELQDKRGIITTSTGLGDAYKELGQYNLAEDYFNRALITAREMKLMLDESRTLFQIGLLNKRRDNIPLAKKHILEGLKLARLAGDSTLSAKINGELIGLGLQEKKQIVENTLFTNIQTFITSGDRNGVADEYARLSEHYASKKQFDKAYFYLQKHELLKDSIAGNSVLLQIKQLEEQYQNEKNQQEIELLKKDQELQTLALSRERTNVMLIAIALFSVVFISIVLVNRFRVLNRAKRQIELEKVRNHIARDLHDDIGSTLSSIKIMSQLPLNGNTNQQLEKIAIHVNQMMETMDDIVWSINPKNDTLEQIVIKMKEFASEILEPKEIEHTFEFVGNANHVVLDVEKRKNIFLIFKEAVNNAAKYSGASHITITLFIKDQAMGLSIRDNGSGFSENKIKPGNGLVNMKERASAIGGEFMQISNPENGTEVRVTIPIT